jgi:MFS family permease
VTISGPHSHDPYRSLRYRDFQLLLAGGFIGTFGQQMLTIALGWELYNRTGSAFVLGGIGLAQVIPLFLFTLPAGHVADRYNRKYVVVASEAGVAVASLGLALLSAQRGPLALVYLCLSLMGAAQAFSGPAMSALAAQMIPTDAFENATTWRSSSWQLSAVLGPAAGGFLVGLLHGATWVFALNAGAAIVYVVLLALTRPRTQETVEHDEPTLRSVVEGIVFLRQTPVLLAAITLDLFAVLFGGAVTLLPIYAKTILHVGPFGLGWLQAASSFGAVLMALYLTRRPSLKRAGPTLLLSVAGFGAATVIFGVSRWFWLSLVMLAILGALDNISVVVRGTLLLVRTPDRMRGRVGAVNSLFIGTSNQLGGFESGLAAQLLGPVVAVVAGGIATVLVVGLVSWYWPEMRNLGSMTETEVAA